MKKQLLLLIFILMPALLFAHNQPLPVVTVHFTTDESAIACKATIPTFALEPAKNLSDDCPREDIDNIMPKIADILDTACPVRIDGIQVKPVLSSVHLYTPPQRDPSTYPAGIEPLAKPWIEATIEYSYSLKGKPDLIRMAWTLFPQKAALEADIVEIDIDDLNEALVLAKFFGKERMVSFIPDETVYLWYGDKIQDAPIKPIAVTRILIRYDLAILTVVAVILVFIFMMLQKRGKLSKYPSAILTAGCIIIAVLSMALFADNIYRWKAARSGPEEAEALWIFSSLHRNLYRAFDYKEESDVYDALSHSISGEMLEKTYKDIMKIMNVKDGPFIQINRVKIMDSRLMTSESNGSEVSIDCTWRVTGLVEHYGHVHTRVNEHRGIFTMKILEDIWKIVNLDIKSYERVAR